MRFDEPTLHELHLGVGHTELFLDVEEYTGNFDNNTHALYAQTHYEYGWMGQLTRVTNALGHITTITYDVLERKVSMSDPNMGSWQYWYDNNGNLIRQQDAKGQNLFFQYDPLNRLTRKQLNDNFGVFDPNVILATYTYDQGANGIGRRTAIWVHTVTEKQWSYDARGRVTQERVVVPPMNGVPHWVSTEYSYDSADRVVSMKYPNNEVVTLSYDDAMRPRALVGWSTYASNATYNALGLLIGMDHGNGVATRLYYYGSNLEYTAAGSVAIPGLEARWQTSRGGHLIVVGAEDRDRAPNRWAALVAHELFHAFQREVAHEQPHTAHRAYAFTTQQMEREAFIF